MANVVKLTKRMIQTRPSPERDEVLWCSTVKGFGVRFYPSGKKAFILKKRIGSGRLAKQRKMTLGNFPAMSLVVAQKKALEAIAKMQSGEDIVQQRIDGQKAEKEKRDAEMSVSDIIDRWLVTDALRSRMRGQRFGTLRNPKYVKHDGNQLKRHVRPLIGEIKLSELTKKDIKKMQNEISIGKTAITERTGFRRSTQLGRSKLYRSSRCYRLGTSCIGFTRGKPSAYPRSLCNRVPHNYQSGARLHARKPYGAC